jgi:hypothetical protein
MSASSSNLPGTPEETTPRRAAMTRSFTVPPRLTVSTRTNPTPEIGAADGIETLYVHPSASIIKFNTGGSRPSSSSGSPRAKQTDSSGTLPWAYPTESTVAVGPMEIYRVPGSVSFLHSGALLHAILPRSQCWCVDGVSKFAFRVLPETYYRIELPGETTEDLELVEALKATLKKVLFYERTPCPFARGFTVDLPAEEIKVKKRNSVREGPAKKWRMEKTYSWKPEGWEEEELKRQLAAGSSRPAGGKSSEPSDEDNANSDQSEAEEQERIDAVRVSPSKLRPTALGSMRSVTAPAQVRTQQTLPSRVRSRVQAVETVDRAQKAERVRFTAEVERRSSVRVKRLSTIPVDMPPSPPDSSAGAEIFAGEDANDLSEDAENTLDEVEEEDATNQRDPAETVSLGEGVPISDSELDMNSAAAKDEDTIPAPAESEETPISGSQTPVIEPEETGEHNTLTHSEPEEDAVPSEETSVVQQNADVSALQNGEAEQDEIEKSTNAASSSRAPKSAEDPYAAIQARIQARRSIGGSTTSFQLTNNPPISKSSSSSASLVSIASQRSAIPNRAQRNHSITAALVNKACAVFLGPPAHLVTMMLRIAARFSSGAFGSNSMFFVESPIGSPRRIPGSFYLEDEEDNGGKSEEEDWDEDDFGVPLKSPVRLSGLRERARRHGWELE